MALKDHPTVKWFYNKADILSEESDVGDIDREKLKEIAREAGADDCGVADINGTGLEGEREEILALYPKTRSLISIVVKLNSENVRCVSRAVSDLEFIQGFERTNAVARKLTGLLKALQINTVHPSAGFPMDVSRWPGRMWSVSHKTVAVTAGMGQLGRNRLLIHPEFGNFIVLGTLLIDRAVSKYDSLLDYNPCIECGLCTAACPVGAVSADGNFSFVNCMTHNYRDRMGGFSDWIENIVKSSGVKDYRSRVNDTETVSMWQSLSYGICNKSSYCMAACPAGKEHIGQYLTDKRVFRDEVVKPLQDNNETIFVIPGSDAHDYVRKKYPHKQIKKVGTGIRPPTAAGFLGSLGLIFQKGRSEGIDATYHFTFTGDEEVEGTVDIKDMAIEMKPGLEGKPDISIVADSKTWLDFLAGEKNLFAALIQRKIKIKGSPSLMKDFSRCFPL